MIRNILKEPNSDLRLKSKPVKEKEINTDEFQELIDDMVKTMQANEGIGLAAAQVGERKRLIIVQTKTGLEAFVNPKITGRSLLHTQSEEGCLSIPGIYGLVKRNRRVSVKALDRHGKKVKMRVGGMEAIIFQHEIDHLNGILFTDRVNHFTNPPKL
ncbi:MAG: peptide deformylase [Candidatus Uhrbacteria bacterium]